MLKQSKKIITLVSVIIGVCLIWIMLAAQPLSLAQTSSSSTNDMAMGEECNGLDIIYLLDESASMKYNDRHKLRSAAVHTAIDMLGDNAIYFCPGVQHRIAVLGFGDREASEGLPDVKVYITPTVIAPSLDTLASWNTERQNLKSAVPVSEDLGATDHESALKAAAQILRSWQENPIGSEPRKRAVVIVTDGEPCVVDEGCRQGRYTFNRERYMKRVETLTDPLGSEFPWRGEDNPQSVQIWLVGFRDASRGKFNYLEDSATRPTWDRITQSHGGEVIALQPGPKETMNADLIHVIATIQDSLLGSRLKPWDCREPIWVDPYRSNVTIIHIFRYGANPGVALEDVVVRIKAMRGETTLAEFSRGKVISGTGKVNDYTQDGLNERYVFYLPPPGKYIVEVEGADICKDLDVQIGQSGVKIKQLEPVPGAVFSEVDEPPYYDTVTPSLFRFQLLQQSEQGKIEPLEENPDFPLDLHLTVYGQGDVAEPVEDEYTLVRVDETEAIYESRDRDTLDPQYIHTRYPGHYTWKLVGTTRNPRELDTENPVTEPVRILEAQGSFTVVPVEHFGFQVLEPGQGDVILASDIAQGKPVPVPIQVSIQFTDTKGNVIDPEQVLADDTADTFELRLLDASNRLLETANLAWSPGEPTFSTEMRALSANQIPDLPGEYRLEVNLLSNYERGKYRPIVSQRFVTFRREKAREFDFTISRPSEGEEFPLIEGVATQPLPVEVQVLGGDGKPLEPDLSIAPPEASPFRASLVDSTGQTLDTQQMQLKGENTYVAKLGSSKEEPTHYDAGCYQITVALTKDYRSQVFRPKRQEATPRQVCMVLVQKFNWQIVQPISGTYAIHPVLGWFPPPRPLPLVVQVTSQEGLSLEANDVLRSNAQALFKGQLEEPGRNVAYDLDFRADENAGQFVAEWPSQAANKGTYVLKVWPVTEASSARWMPAREEPLVRSFKREDTMLTMPWSLLALITLAIIILVAAFLIHLASGKLYGVVLVFTKEQ